LHYKVSNKQC